MILAVDIGNTQTSVCLLDGDQVVHNWRLSSRLDRPPQELAVTLKGLFDLDGFDPRQTRAVVIGSVVGPLTPQFVWALERLTGRPPLTIDGHTPMPVTNGYGNPNQVGVDRLANAVGGVQRYGAPLIVVDFGTAITFDVISPDHVYLGGVILPGPEMMAESLAAGTSSLPRIALEPTPDSVIGRTTRDSIAAGITYGITGTVDSLVARIRQELEAPDCVAVATGGRAAEYVRHSEALSAYEPFLTLWGLRDIWQYQSESSLSR